MERVRLEWSRLASALLMATVPIVTAAQDVSTLPPGTRLRVNGRCAVCVARTGDFVRMQLDTLWLRTGSRDQPIPRADIVTLEMSRQRDRLAGAGKGAALGFVLAGGLCTAFAIGADDNSGEGIGRRAWFVIGLIGCGSVGAAVGVIAGAAAGGEEWVHVPLPPPA